MKKITLCMAAALFCLTVSAQVAEDFEDSALPAGWSTVINTGDCDFEFGMVLPAGPDFSSIGIFFDDDGCGNGEPASNVTLLTAVYDFTGNTADVTLGYEVAYFDIAGVDDSFVVEYFDGSAWIEVTSYVEVDLAETVLESFNLGAIANADFQVRFTYNDGDDWSWYGGIDNFSLDGGTLSTDNNQITGFSMFPNPAASTFNITAGTTIDNVKVFNLLGQVVLDQKVNATSQTLDVSAFKTGAYLVQVTSEGQVGTYKLLKQ